MSTKSFFFFFQIAFVAAFATTRVVCCRLTAAAIAIAIAIAAGGDGDDDDGVNDGVDDAVCFSVCGYRVNSTPVLPSLYP